MKNPINQDDTDRLNEELRLTIQDTLADTVLQEAKLMFSHKKTQRFLVGWYVTYYIPGDLIMRAVYLGSDLKTIKRKFNLWVKNWMVQ